MVGRGAGGDGQRATRELHQFPADGEVGAGQARQALAGQLAVGEVIANRAHSGGRFPSSYCGVLFQRGQFSFISGRSWPAVARSSLQWRNAVAIAQIVDQDLKDSGAPGALFFHAKRVQPHWRLTRVASIGNHVFYR